MVVIISSVSIVSVVNLIDRSNLRIDDGTGRKRNGVSVDFRLKLYSASR